ALRAGGARAAMATLVGTEGASPRLDGARMFVGEDGRILGGVTIGGCVDARVVEAAEGVLASGERTLLEIALSDAEGWELGLSCGGLLRVAVEPLAVRDAADPVLRAYDAVRAERAAGRRAAIVTLLEGRPARMVVREDGGTVGSLGGAARDAAARAAALEAIRRGTSGAADLGEGEGRCFVEVHAPPTTLIVYGAGPVAPPLTAIGRTLGWRSVIVDARERWATRARFPQADEIRTGIVEEIAESFAYGPTTLVVITAHDYKVELPVLRVVLRRAPAYIGLLGSRRRGRALKQFLADEGFPPEALARVKVPVGLDLGAASAAEIALAVAAEALAARTGRGARPLSEDA
ncbi:MAG TPA: XdhC family protein, partial [Gemmatimonadaceae bacterium]|nr:XdhC family protein [Gemmatimonadaceae bacterium]